MTVYFPNIFSLDVRSQQKDIKQSIAVRSGLEKNEVWEVLPDVTTGHHVGATDENLQERLNTLRLHPMS